MSYRAVNIGYPRGENHGLGGGESGRILTFSLYMLGLFYSSNRDVLYFHNLKFIIKKKGKLLAHLTTRKKKDNCV